MHQKQRRKLKEFRSNSIILWKAVCIIDCFHLWGFLRTKMTESPLRKSLVMYRSFFIGFDFLPCEPRGSSVHISSTFSKTMFMCLSKARTLARILRLLRNAISTYVFALTALKSSEKGPYEKVSSGVSFFSSSIASLNYILKGYLSITKIFRLNNRIQFYYFLAGQILLINSKDKYTKHASELIIWLEFSWAGWEIDLFKVESQLKWIIGGNSFWISFQSHK